MATITQSYEEPNNLDGTWSHVFQGGNVVWLFDQTQRMGNFFIGLQGQTQNAWDTQIPPGSTILAATMEYLPFNNNFNPSFDTTMNSPDRSQQLQIQDPLQSPFQIFRGYRRDFWSNAQVGALSTTFTAVFGTSVTTNSSWIMRQIASPGSTIAHRDHMAQRITTRTGNMTINILFWELRRTGNPTGNLTVRIQGVAVDRGVDVPDGIDIAVSNPVLASSVPLAATLTSFTFPANPTLVALTDYFILIEPEYTANNADYISVHHQNTFLTNGQLFHFGEGRGMDWQNHPGVVDLNQAHQATTLAGEDVIWPIDLQTVGIPEVSPDITSLVQAQIDASNYTADSGIIIALSRVVPTAQGRIASSNVHGSNAGPILRLTYEEPVPVPPPTKLADPYVGPSRFPSKVKPSEHPPGWEPFDLSYFRTKYATQRQDVQPDTPAVQLQPDIVQLDIDKLEEILAAIAAREAELAALELLEEQQRALVVELEQNRIDAREALLAAMRIKQRQNNNLAAIAATMQYFY